MTRPSSNIINVKRIHSDNINNNYNLDNSGKSNEIVEYFDSYEYIKNKNSEKHLQNKRSPILIEDESQILKTNNSN